MRTIICPNEILAISAEQIRGSGAISGCELLIVVFKNLFGELGRGDDDIQSRAKPDGHDRSVNFGPFPEALKSDGRDVVEVANEGQGARARGESESPTEEENGKEGKSKEEKGEEEEIMGGENIKIHNLEKKMNSGKNQRRNVGRRCASIDDGQSEEGVQA